MLNKIKFIIWLLIILVVAFFVSLNSEPKISIKLFFNYQTVPLPLSLIIIGSIILGAILILIMAITDWISFKIENLKYKKRIKSLEKEIESLKKDLEKCNSDLKDCNDKLQNSTQTKLKENS